MRIAIAGSYWVTSHNYAATGLNCSGANTGNMTIVPRHFLNGQRVRFLATGIPNRCEIGIGRIIPDNHTTGGKSRPRQTQKVRVVGRVVKCQNRSNGENLVAKCRPINILRHWGNPGIPPGFVFIDIVRICQTTKHSTPDTLVIAKSYAHIANNFPIVRNVRVPVRFGLVMRQWNTHTCAHFVDMSMFRRRPRPYYNAIRLAILPPLYLRPNRPIG